MKANRNKLHNPKAYSKNRGTAMIAAIIIIAVLMVFTFSLMLVTYTLYASQNKKLASQRNREAANTLSVAIRKELESDSANADSWLWRYLRCNLYQDSTWPYYDPDAPSENAYRYFNLYRNSNYEVDGFPGNVKLRMYWSLPPGITLSDVQKLSDLPIDDKKNAILYVEIICETAKQSYTVQNKYKISISQFDSTAEDISEKRTLEKTVSDKNFNPMALTISDNEKWRFVFQQYN
ncbi:MAG: hypothetical protein K6B68_08965 [Eubacterium sp.]|nr:hypothetical protein [Eubacterium sp.]